MIIVNYIISFFKLIYHLYKSLFLLSRYAIDCLMRGIYSGKSTEISIKSVFPKVINQSSSYIITYKIYLLVWSIISSISIITHVTIKRSKYYS